MVFKDETSEDFARQIVEARSYLEAGKVSKAGDILEHVAYKTWDRQQLQEIHDLAEQGLSKTGRFGKGKWKGILSTTDMELRRRLAESEDQSARTPDA